MHQNGLAAGLRADPLAELSAPPDLPTGFKAGALCDRERRRRGQERAEEGSREKGKGREREGGTCSIALGIDAPGSVVKKSAVK